MKKIIRLFSAITIGLILAFSVTASDNAGKRKRICFEDFSPIPQKFIDNESVQRTKWNSKTNTDFCLTNYYEKRMDCQDCRSSKAVDVLMVMEYHSNTYYHKMTIRNSRLLSFCEGKYTKEQPAGLSGDSEVGLFFTSNGIFLKQSMTKVKT